MTKTANYRVLTLMAAVLVPVLVVTIVVGTTGEAEAAFPGANGRIAFSIDLPSDLDSEIYTVGSSGLGLSALTNNNVYDYDATFSADGQKLAFASERGGDTSDVYVINANLPEGSANSAVRVTTSRENDRFPTFSPDGSKIAFERIRADRSGSDIYVKNADGSGSATLLADVGRWDIDPEWSPEGGSVAFVSSNSGLFWDAGIYTTEALGGGALLRITDSGESAKEPSWSPDGEQIAYTRRVATNENSNVLVPEESGVYRTSSDGTGAPIAVVNVSRSWESSIHTDMPAWSPDGTKIAFVRYQRIRESDEVRTDIYRVNSAGSGTPTFVTAAGSGEPDTDLDWQPLVPLFVWPSRALTIDWRDALTIPGRLFSGPGNPMPDQKVYLEKRPAGSEKFTLTPGAEATTAEDGAFRFEKVEPSENTDYRAHFAGNEAKGFPPATSPIRRINVRVLVSERLSSTNLKLGGSLTVSGAVAPAHDGKVTLLIRRNGKALAEKSADLLDSRYSLRYKPGAAGEYTVSARYPTHADHQGNTSPRRSFEVVR